MNSIVVLSPEMMEGARTILCLMDDGGLPVRGSSIEGSSGYASGALEEDFSLSSDTSGYLRLGSDSPLLGLGMNIAVIVIALRMWLGLERGVVEPPPIEE